jgi:hypothetical protein
MKTATFELAITSINGKKAIEIIVRNSIWNAPLHSECERLGLVPTVDIANRRSITVTTPAELESIRAPLLKFFGASPVNGQLTAI